MKQVVLHLYLVSCLCWSQPLLPLVPGLSHISLLQDMTDMAAAGEDMTAAADMATAAGDMAMMAAGTPALMFLSTFLPGLGIGVLKGMLFSVLMERNEGKMRLRQRHGPDYHHSRTHTDTNTIARYQN